MQNTATQTTVIEQSTKFFNPSFLEGKQIERIIFFNPETGERKAWSKWFGRGSNNDYKKMFFPFEIKRKIKHDQHSKTAYYIKSNYEHANKGSIDILIPSTLLNFKEYGEQERYTTDRGTQHENTFSFVVDCVKRCHRLNSMKELEYYYEEKNAYKVEFFNFTRFEKNEQSKKAQRIYKAVKDIAPSLSEYDLNNMLKVLNITVKRK